MDFEDVSLMPPYWDMASYVGNLALFQGHMEPNFQLFMERASDKQAFLLAVKARTLMSTLGNLDLALEGFGDMKGVRLNFLTYS